MPAPIRKNAQSEHSNYDAACVSLYVCCAALRCGTSGRRTGCGGWWRWATAPPTWRRGSRAALRFSSGVRFLLGLLVCVLKHKSRESVDRVGGLAPTGQVRLDKAYSSASGQPPVGTHCAPLQISLPQVWGRGVPEKYRGEGGLVCDGYPRHHQCPAAALTAQCRALGRRAAQRRWTGCCDSRRR